MFIMETLRMRKILVSRLRNFRKVIWKYYCLSKRDFPWRRTQNPYKILVSEIMLQQTQVDRVMPKYEEFIKKFPNFSALHKASLKSVLKTWQGLGYNRRALQLKAIAREVAGRFNGQLPNEKELLISLPGIGQSTAGAVRAFAFNKPEIFVETNIRTVFIYFFFPKKRNVLDADISELIAATLDYENPREWYWALMDYGAMLKKKFGNAASRRSAHYAVQSPFEGSTREQRSKILRVILEGQISVKEILAKSNFSKRTLSKHLTDLAREGFIEKKGNVCRISRRLSGSGR